VGSWKKPHAFNKTMADEVSAMSGGKKRNSWMTHMNKTRRANPGKSLGAIMKMAKKTYKKGGADEEPMMGGAPLTPLPLSGGASLSPQPLNGGRRRASRKTRKASKKSRKGGRKH
jgi:hypothetical protein